MHCRGYGLILYYISPPIAEEKLYIRTELMHRNEALVAPEFENSTLTDRYNQIAAMVKEKTGRAMQTKDRLRVSRKTGRASTQPSSRRT